MINKGPMDVDEDGIPIGWELVTLTDSERDALVEACDTGNLARAEKTVDGAYDRLFGSYVN